VEQETNNFSVQYSIFSYAFNIIEFHSNWMLLQVNIAKLETSGFFNKSVNILYDAFGIESPSVIMIMRKL